LDLIFDHFVHPMVLGILIQFVKETLGKPEMVVPRVPDLLEAQEIALLKPQVEVEVEVEIADPPIKDPLLKLQGLKGLQDRIEGLQVLLQVLQGPKGPKGPNRIRDPKDKIVDLKAKISDLKAKIKDHKVKIEGHKIRDLKAKPQGHKGPKDLSLQALHLDLKGLKIKGLKPQNNRLVQ